MKQSRSNPILDSKLTTLSNFKKDKILISLNETEFQRQRSQKELEQLNQYSQSLDQNKIATIDQIRDKLQSSLLEISQIVKPDQPWKDALMADEAKTPQKMVSYDLKIN